MITITALHRAILDALDKAEHGAGDTEICEALGRPVGDDAVLHALVELMTDELVDARFADDLRDCAITADPIIYALSDTGAEALWALMRADAAATLPRPVHFTNRAAMREYLRSAA